MTKKIISKIFKQNLTFFKDFYVCFCFANLEHIFSKLSEYIFKQLGLSDCQKNKKIVKKIIIFLKKMRKKMIFHWLNWPMHCNACLRVPLNPQFCREVAEFFGFFLADFGGLVRNRRKMDTIFFILFLLPNSEKKRCATFFYS